MKTFLQDLVYIYDEKAKDSLRISDFSINLTDDQLEKLLTKATFYGKRTLGSFITLDPYRIKDIYTLTRLFYRL